MNRTSRNAVAAALTAVVAFGMTAPEATAAPKHAHAKAHHQVTKAHKGAKADRTLTPAQRRLTRVVARKDAYLGRLVKSPKVVRLADGVEEAVVASITGDCDDLDAIKAGVAGAKGEDLKALARDLRKIRPEVYNTIINQLRLATRMQTAAAGLTVAGDLDTLIQTLEGYDATVSRADLRAAQRVLSKVKTAIDAADGDSADTPDAPETPDVPAEGATTP